LLGKWAGVRLYLFEKPFPEIPPILPFSKGGELLSDARWKISLFPPLEKGEEGGFYGYSKD
jgi:hypothetical protein